MSAQETVADALPAPIDNNAQAAEDAKKLLAEIEADAPTATETTSKPENNGATNGDKEMTTEKSEDVPEDASKPEGDKRDRGKGRDRDDRRGGRGGGQRGGRGGNRGGKHGRDNIKSVLTQEEKSDDQAAIRKQIEFYFSDSNLPQDAFLLDKVGGNENHPVDLSIIRSFKRMRHFEPLEAIIEALKSSKTVKLVENDTKVQRQHPLAKATDDGVNHDHIRVFEDKAIPRSVYAKGFGEELPSSQFDIEAFFAQHGPTNAVRLRRTDDKIFKSSVFAEFENEELATSFLALDPKPQYQGRDLQIMSKKEYCDKKVEDIKSGKVKANNRFEGKTRGRGGKNYDGNRRGGDDNRDWRTRRDEDRKNGFRDDKRRGGREDRDRKGGRERRRSVEKDERGIPVVKTGTDGERDQAKVDAVAKARAAVEAETKKENDAETTEPKAEPKVEEVQNTEAGVKREREEDGDDAPPAKKVDAKVDA